MCLVNGGATSDRIAHGTGTIGSPWSAAFWIYPTTLTANRGLANKGTAAGNTRRIQLLLSGTGGDVTCVVDRATTDTTVTSTSTPLATLNKWYWVCVSFDAAGGIGQVVRIYVGDVSSAATEVTYAVGNIDGVGAVTTDDGVLYVGNLATLTAAFQGRLGAAFFHSGAVKTLTEFNAERLTPDRANWSRLFVIEGYAGAVATQKDRSAAADDGTVTGSTFLDSTVDLPFLPSMLYRPEGIALSPLAGAVGIAA